MKESDSNIRLTNDDRKILRYLERFGLAKLSTLAANVGRSLPAFRKRLKQLESAGYINSLSLIGRTKYFHLPCFDLQPWKVRRAMAIHSFIVDSSSHRFVYLEEELQVDFPDLAPHLVSQDHYYLGEHQMNPPDCLYQLHVPNTDKVEVIRGQLAKTLASYEEVNAFKPYFEVGAFAFLVLVASKTLSKALESEPVLGAFGWEVQLRAPVVQILREL